MIFMQLCMRGIPLSGCIAQLPLLEARCLLLYVFPDKIFKIFERLKPDEGTGEGLGLTIIRSILDRHKGKIWVESEPGKGSKFFVSLPT